MASTITLHLINFHFSVNEHSFLSKKLEQFSGKIEGLHVSCIENHMKLKLFFFQIKTLFEKTFLKFMSTLIKLK